MKTLTVKGMEVGCGVPKTIISLMGTEENDLLAQLARGIKAGASWFEYRADFAADVHDVASMVAASCALREAAPVNPVLFTFRSESQGGRATLLAEEYAALCQAVISARAADAIDIESWIGDDAVRRLCGAAHAAGIATVVSFHDFNGTPEEDNMVAMLEHFAELGADIPKIAVMAHTPADALAVLSATNRVATAGKTGPLLTMAMGATGSITRLSGELFGCALTFCSLDTPSAPGQVDVEQALAIMGQLHEIANR